MFETAVGGHPNLLRQMKQNKQYKKRGKRIRGVSIAVVRGLAMAEARVRSPDPAQKEEK